MTEPYTIRRSGEYVSSPNRTSYREDDEAFDGTEAISLTRWASRDIDGRSDISSTEENEYQSLQFTRDEENAVVRKLDRRLVLFVAVLYMFSFLDRSSMSFSLFDQIYRDTITHVASSQTLAMRRLLGSKRILICLKLNSIGY